MKNKLILGLALAMAVASCDQEDSNANTVYDVNGGQTALSFQSTSFNTSVPEEDLTFQIPVNVTTVSDVDRTFAARVVSATNDDEFTVGNVVIPAGEYSGNLSIDFDFSEIDGDDGELKEVVVELADPEGGNTYNSVATVSYFREIICNDAVLTLTTDFFADETGFVITDSDGNAVFEIFQGQLPQGANTYNLDVFLEDGCYTATITDQFGDGQVDGTNPNGSYSLDCSIIQLASGGGAFGSTQSRDFCVNTDDDSDD